MNKNLRDIFCQRFPEFSETDPLLVKLVLDEAQAEVDQALWGAKYQAGLFMLAAHKLACSPFGEPARLEGSKESTYGLEFERMKKSLGFGLMVI